MRNGAGHPLTLTIAFIFYSRHWLGRFMFPSILPPRPAGFGNALRILMQLLPLLLLVASAILIFRYNWMLNTHVRNLETNPITRNALVPSDSERPTSSRGWEEAILQKAPRKWIPTALMFYYIGIFVTAEAAFVLMALREYMQDLLQVADIDLIRSG